MFVVKEKNMSKFITDNIDISSNDSDKKNIWMKKFKLEKCSTKI